MCIRGQDFVIGREQDRAHQDKRDCQFGNKRDGVAVNAGSGGSVTDRFVCQSLLKHERVVPSIASGPECQFFRELILQELSVAYQGFRISGKCALGDLFQ